MKNEKSNVKICFCYKYEQFIYYTIYNNSLVEKIVNMIYEESDLVVYETPFIPVKRIDYLMISKSKYVIGSTYNLAYRLLDLLKNESYDKRSQYYPKEISNYAEEIDFAVDWSDVFFMVSEIPISSKLFNEEMDKYFDIIRNKWKEKGILK